MKSKSAVFVWNRPIKATGALLGVLELLSYDLIFLQGVNCFWFLGKSPFNELCYEAFNKWSGKKKFALIYADEDYESLIDICQLVITYKDNGKESAVNYAKRADKTVMDLSAYASDFVDISLY